jgi:CheY-like chemotaxis protein
VHGILSCMQDKKILIIDDDLMFCDMIAEVLQAEGAVVDVVHDGVQGVQRSEANHPDLIVSDYMMPAMHGDEVLRTVRASEWGANVPFILLTNMNQPEVMPGGVNEHTKCLLKTDLTLEEIVAEMQRMIAGTS